MKFSPTNIIKVTLMVAVGAFILKYALNTVAPGSGLVRYIP